MSLPIFLLAYLAVGLITYVVFAWLDEKFLEPEDQNFWFPVMAGTTWPLTWVVFVVTFVFAATMTKD